MRILKSGFYAVTTSLALAGCGSKDSTTDDSSPDTTVASNPVSNLTKLPDTADFASSNKASLTLTSFLLNDADAVTGLPPTFSTIKADNMETYFTGSISTLISSMKDAKGKKDWATLKSLVDSFHSASAKCQQIEDVARSMTVLAENTSSLCYMSKIGSKGSGALTFVSGETTADGDFFKPKADGTDTVRQITYGADVRKFQIYGAKSVPNGYKLAFARCDATTPKEYTVVTVDNAAGTFVLSNFGSRPLRNNMTADDFSFKLESALKYDAATSTYTFDKAKDRNFTAKNYRVDPTRTNTFNGSLTVSGSTLLSKLFMKDIFTAADANAAAIVQTELRKGINYASFTGATVNDIKVFEGAGFQSSVRSHTGLGASTSFEQDATIGFEFNNTKSPQYDSVTKGIYVDKVTALAAGIATLSPFDIAAPTVPDALPTEATTLCAATASTIVQAKPRDSDAIKAIEKSCDDKRNLPGGRSTCDKIRENGPSVMNFLNERRVATGASGKGN